MLAKAVGCLILLLVTGLSAQVWAQPSPYAPWTGKSVGAPKGLSPSAPDAPLLESPRFERRSYELALAASVNQRLCNHYLDACDNAPGVGLQLAFLQRPSPYFSWGLQADYASWNERLQHGASSADLQAKTLAGLLVGRLALFRHGVVDPFIQAGVGGGRFNLQGTLGETGAAGSLRTAAQGTSIAPLYQAALGVDLHVSEAFRVGGAFSWTHWLLSDFERCNNVAFGVCSSPKAGMFDLENATWSLGLRSSVAFGQVH